MIKKNSKSIIRRNSSLQKKRPLSFASTDLLTIEELPKKKINRRTSLMRLKDFFSSKKSSKEINEDKGQKYFRRNTSIHSIEFWEA